MISVYGSRSANKRSTTFQELNDSYRDSGVRLSFATNGGMFHTDLSPVGLLVQNGIEQSPVNLSAGEGNFFLMPNGVFLISHDGKPAIVTSDRYGQVKDKVQTATQSGPMLVIDGRINSNFQEGSANRLLRSGIGVIDSHTVVFAISSQPVNFWDFARMFRDVFRCRNALYLDGVISEFYTPAAREPNVPHAVWDINRSSQ